MIMRFSSIIIGIASISTSSSLTTAFFLSPATTRRHGSLWSSTQSDESKTTTTNPDHLVTKEANIKGTVQRTQPTQDPFNPDFERILSVAFKDAFPSSTKEYKTV